jgi:hypothetical protein
VRGASISNHLRRSSRARHAPEPASAGNFCHSMTLSGRWPQTRHESPKSKNAFPPRSCTHQARPVRSRPLPFHERTCPNSNWDGRVALTPILLSKSIPAPRFLWRDGTCQIVSRKVTVPVEVPFSAKTKNKGATPERSYSSEPAPSSSIRTRCSYKPHARPSSFYPPPEHSPGRTQDRRSPNSS